MSRIQHLLNQVTDSIGQHPREILNYHNDDDLGNYVEDVIRKHRSHQSIAKIKETVDVRDSFMFHKVSVMDVKTRLKSLNMKKSAGYDTVSPKLMKLGADILCYPTQQFINRCIEMCLFPTALTKAEITPLHKKDDIKRTMFC